MTKQTRSRIVKVLLASIKEAQAAFDKTTKEFSGANMNVIPGEAGLTRKQILNRDLKELQNARKALLEFESMCPLKR